MNKSCLWCLPPVDLHQHRRHQRRERRWEYQLGLTGIGARWTPLLSTDRMAALLIGVLLLLKITSYPVACHLLWKTSLWRQCLKCLGKAQAPPEKYKDCFYQAFLLGFSWKTGTRCKSIKPESQSSVSNQMHLPHSSTTWCKISRFEEYALQRK